MSEQQEASVPKGSVDFSEWVGRREARSEVIEHSRVAALAATLDLPASPAPGEALPPGWQWLFFNPVARRSELGADGHPKRGGFLPPIALPRRLWAGSRLAYPGSVAIGDAATRSSEIVQIQNKTGKRGPLWFVTVRHVIAVKGKDCIVEEQDIVYRDAGVPGSPPPIPEPAPDGAAWQQRVHPDTTLLFRYSALTFNGHRIHYDQDYARNEEGYPDLVVHGPLTATLLQGFVLENNPGRRLKTFDFRGVNPLHVGRAFTLEGRHDADREAFDLWARGPNGELSMRAVATLDG